MHAQEVPHTLNSEGKGNYIEHIALATDLALVLLITV
jgi:hypothetical protein